MIAQIYSSKSSGAEFFPDFVQISDDFCHSLHLPVMRAVPGRIPQSTVS